MFWTNRRFSKRPTHGETSLSCCVDKSGRQLYQTSPDTRYSRYFCVDCAPGAKRRAGRSYPLWWSSLRARALPPSVCSARAGGPAVTPPGYLSITGDCLMIVTLYLASAGRGGCCCCSRVSSSSSSVSMSWLPPLPLELDTLDSSLQIWIVIVKRTSRSFQSRGLLLVIVLVVVTRKWRLRNLQRTKLTIKKTNESVYSLVHRVQFHLKMKSHGGVWSSVGGCCHLVAIFETRKQTSWIWDT